MRGKLCPVLHDMKYLQDHNYCRGKNYSLDMDMSPNLK